MRLFTLIFLFVWAVSLKAQQNLVPNPSFEDTLICPTNMNQIVYAYSWSSSTLGGTPDYFNECSGGNVDVPTNYFGQQNANSGSAYAGIVSFMDYEDDTLSHNYREYIQIQLLHSLVIGESYEVKFYISLADISWVATNGIGVYFSTVPIQENNFYPLPYLPQIISNTVVSDLYNWIEISGVFIANESFEYLSLGNFYSGNNLTLDTLTPIQNYPESYYSYYYIDDVSVTLDVTTSVAETEKPNIKIYPNPASNNIEIQLADNDKHYSVEIYDSFGRLVIQSSINNQTSTIPLNLSSGVYILRLTDKDESQYIQKLIVN